MIKEVKCQNEVNLNNEEKIESLEQYNNDGTIVRVKYKQGGKSLNQLLEEYLYKL